MILVLTFLVPNEIRIENMRIGKQGFVWLSLILLKQEEKLIRVDRQEFVFKSCVDSPYFSSNKNKSLELVGKGLIRVIVSRIASGKVKYVSNTADTCLKYINKRLWLTLPNIDKWK